MQRESNALTGQSGVVQQHDPNLSDLRTIDVPGRREWLKSVMMGGVGLGLFGIPLPSLADEAADASCPRIIRFSKDLTAEIGGFRCTPCDCNKVKVYSIGFEFKGKLAINRICDESVQWIPDGSIMSGSMRMTLRTAKCPDTGRVFLLGCHSGKFQIISPASVNLFSGEFSGTQGVDHRAKGAARCCWPNGEGAMRGSGIENLKNCSLCTGYILAVPLNVSEPCSRPTRPLSMRIDGSMMCPC